MMTRALKICLVAVFACLQACNLEEDSAAAETELRVHDTTSRAIDTINAGERDTLILLKDGEAFVKGHINSGKTKPTYTLPAWEGQSVLAVLNPVSKGGNVRFNRVQLPGGDFEGPFGDTVRLRLKNSGKLKFLVGENLMAGKRYNGDFVLHIRVK